MLYWLLIWILTSGVLLLTSFFIKGFTISGYPAALVASVFIGLLNVALRPILLILTLPINILTLGLFTFVINAMILKITAYFLKGFEIKTWSASIIAAVFISIVQGFLLMFF